MVMATGHTMERSRTSYHSPPVRSTSVPGRPSTDHGGRLQPVAASPEVISSLISSLSAISTPAQSHFDSLPKIESRTAPSSPGFVQTEFVRDQSHAVPPPPLPTDSPGFGMDYGAYKSQQQQLFDETETVFLHPDDAAASPVVRMSKPPTSPRSPRSPRSPLSRRSSRSLPDEPLPLRNSASRASLVSVLGGNDDVVGLGVISLEPGPRLSTASVASNGSGRRKSLKGPLSLLKRASREFNKDAADHAESRRLNSSRSGVSLRSSHSMSNLAEEREREVTESANPLDKALPPANDHSPSPVNRRLSQVEAQSFSPGGIGSGRMIPARESSLRHTRTRASSSKRYSIRHGIEGDIPEDKPEEDGVSRRINEIKDQQKKIRDELLRDNDSPKATPNGRRLSATPAPAAVNGHSGRPEPPRKDFVELRGNDIIDESAPSPTVLTRRAQAGSKRSYGPLASKAPGLERSNSFQSPSQKIAKRHSTDAKSHRRVLSGARSTTQRSSIMLEERPSSADSIDIAVHEYLSAPRLTQKVTHPTTGRVIAFSEVGDPKGHVVFCCVGMGLTRYLTAFYDELARTLKLRLITPDRPGVGESEPCAPGTGAPLSWPGMSF